MPLCHENLQKNIKKISPFAAQGLFQARASGAGALHAAGHPAGLGLRHPRRQRHHRQRRRRELRELRGLRSLELPLGWGPRQADQLLCAWEDQIAVDPIFFAYLQKSVNPSDKSRLSWQVAVFSRISLMKILRYHVYLVDELALKAVQGLAHAALRGSLDAAPAAAF